MKKEFAEEERLENLNTWHTFWSPCIACAPSKFRKLADITSGEVQTDMATRTQILNMNAEQIFVGH